MAGRYLPTELQDSNGDVVYPHTEADIVWMQDGKSVQEFLNADVTDETIKKIIED